MALMFISRDAIRGVLWNLGVLWKRFERFVFRQAFELLGAFVADDDVLLERSKTTR